jgi:hypothetical protein
VGARLDELSQLHGAVILTGALSDGLMNMMNTHVEVWLKCYTDM